MNTSRNPKSKGFFRILIAAALFAVSALSTSAQESSERGGILSASIVDADYGGAVFNARYTLVELGQSGSANQDGRFLASNITPGTYTLLVTAEYYKPARVTEVTITSGEVTRLNVPLYNDSSDVVELSEFVVTAEVLADSDIGLLDKRQKASAISDAIGSETFSRLALGDAAAALSKVTGVSITDGKYMVVRGLSDRYNNTTMNGASVPSADPDKRAVQLDQFPSGIIESITTIKTFTPDKGGNFTGGSVDIKTKSVPDRFFLKLKAGVSFNEKTTGKSILSTQGGGDDWLGKDDGSRAVPEIAERLDEITSSPRRLDDEQKQLLSDISSSFSPEMIGYERDAPLSHSLSVSFGNRFMLSDKPDGPLIGVVGSLSNKRNYKYYDDGQVGRYELSGELQPELDLVEAKGVEESEWGSMLSVAFMPNPEHEVGVNLTFNQSGEDEAISREGFNYETVGENSTFRVQNIHYTERTLRVNQLYGKHLFENLRNTKIDWFYSDAKSVQQEPDFRLFYDAVPLEGKTGIPVYQGNFPTPRRYWRRLDELSEEFKVDFTTPISAELGEVKFGYKKNETDRDFSEKSLIYADYARGLPSGYRYDGAIDGFLSDDLLRLNDNGEVQRYILSSPGEVPEYFGNQVIEAAYLMADLRPSEKWRFVFGARNETSDIKVQSFDSFGEPKGEDGDIQVDDWLPAVNVTYELAGNSNLRFAYTNTLARPNFRELSPFGSFNNVGGETFVGNPELLRSQIDNIDIRYELFPDSGEVLAATLFRKVIEDPIELNFVNGELTYVNVEEAEVNGIELEARKSFRLFGGENSVLSVGGNFSYVDSKVQRSETELQQKRQRDPDISSERELQGQSEVLANMDIGYEHYKLGSAVTLSYNYTGERLYSVALGASPDIFEAPSKELDLVYSQRLGSSMSIRFALKNLLDDSSKKFHPFEDEEYVYSEYKKGITAALSFSYSFD